MHMIREEDRTRLNLGEELTVSNAAVIREKLLEALGQSDQVDIDLADVAVVDLAGLQLLCAAHRTAVAESKTLTISGEQAPPLRQARLDAGFVFHRSCGFCPAAECLWVGGTEK